METNTGSANNFSLKEDLANTLLSKLDINSKFLNDVVDKALSTVSSKIEINDKKISAKIDSLKNNKTKTTEANKTNTKQTQNKENTQSSLYKQADTNKLLSVTNNTFKILTTPETKEPVINTNTETKETDLNTENKNNFLNKFAKAIEKTTSKLEETVKKIPRPWELTPGTSIGYQMLKGEDDAMTERIRKGLAQFMGRYATNIKAPVGYDTLKEELKERNFKETVPFLKDTIKTILKDIGPKIFDMPLQEYASDRDILYREMFDLPSRTTSENLRKLTPKQYTLTETPENKITIAKKINDKSAVGVHDFLRGVYLSETKDKKNYQYNDKWDILTGGEEDKKFQSLMEKSKLEGLMYTIKELQKGKTSPLRQLVSPLLRPATVSGLVSKEGVPVAQDINLSEDITKEVSNKIEQMPIVNSLTKGLEKIKSNKVIDGLKEMSNLAPSLKPVLSFLSTKSKPIIETTNLTNPLTDLNDELKNTTTTKLTEWTDNLYDWSNKQINNFTDSLTENLEITESIKPVKPLKVKTINPLVKSVVQEPIPSLKNSVDTDNININNKTLDKIASNTEVTNSSVKLLSEAILALARAFGSKSNTAPNIVMPAINNTQSSPSPPASLVAANNVDPIRAVRSQFIPDF